MTIRPPLGVHRVGDPAPAGRLLVGGDAGLAGIGPRLGVRVGALGDDQADTGPLAVVLDDQVVGTPAAPDRMRVNGAMTTRLASSRSPRVTGENKSMSAARPLLRLSIPGGRRLRCSSRRPGIAEGTPAELKAHTGGEWLEVRLGDADQASAAMAALEPLAAEEITVDEATLRVPVRRRQGAVAEAVRLLDSAGVAVDDLAVSSPTLNDVFLRLTGHAAEEEETG